MESPSKHVFGRYRQFVLKLNIQTVYKSGNRNNTFFFFLLEIDSEKFFYKSFLPFSKYRMK